MRVRALCVVLLGLTRAATAHAADPKERALCIDAATKAQSFRDEHKLIAAREQLRICARSGCPSAVLRDCVAWLTETETAIPALVFAAKDSAGRDLLDVSVSLDGVVISKSLDGIPIEVDPGVHVVRFEAADGVPNEQTVLAKSGEKQTSVTGIFPVRPAPPSAAAVIATPPVGPPTSTASPPELSGRRPSSPVKTAGFITGAAGLLSLAAGGAAGAFALVKRSELTCVGSSCSPADTFRQGRIAADWATAGLVAGGALAATGLVLVLVAPKPEAPKPLTLSLAPTSIGLQLLGKF